MKKLKISLNKDGIDHINIYSKSKVYLGRLLSNFAHSPINTDDGPFISIEGYWYWLLCSHSQRDELRTKFDAEAKSLGRELGVNDSNPIRESEQFKEKIKKAIRLKIAANPILSKMLKDSKLPFVHYYVHNNKVQSLSIYDWWLDEFTKIREELKKQN
jgi:hypothetical protein